jgi:6,7-dimethyl-8-ribityllumazine synthase
MVAHTRADSAPKPTDPALAGARILVVEARYYDGIADELLAGALAAIEAAHYDIVAGESARALMDLSVQRRVPLGNGILTVETEAQALARARVAEMNKGGGAAEAALGVLALKRAAEAARTR